MRFTSQIRYAVYAVFDMAFHDQGVPHQVKNIARREAIPPRYLEQIFQRLLHAGILRSKRGPRGGYTLARSPKEITLGDIVRATEGSVEALFNGRGKAQPRRGRGAQATASREAVRLRAGEEIWGVVTARMADLLEAITVEDLVLEAQRRGLPRESSSANMYFI